MNEDFNNESTYKLVNTTNKSSFSFGKNVLVPFCSGVIGSALVIGGVFYFPNIRSNILGNSSNTVISTPIANNQKVEENKTSTITNAVSLINYSDTAISVANKVLPSIVGIKVEFPVTSYFYTMTSTTSSTGSGVIISQDGYILTNNHVVSNTSSSSNSFYYSIGEATSVKVYLYNDETAYDAKIIGTDEQTDLAVLKVEKDGLTAATLGDSSSLKVGEFAMAVGNPIGLQSTVTSGIISALDRTIKADGTTYHVIQTDAAINSGNSGGALVNSKGEVIGINTLKISYTGVEGIGFAIPINSTKDIYSQLIQYNKVKRPYIGIEAQTITEALAKKYNLVIGAYVKKVEDFSPAQKADLQVGDVITSINGGEIKSSDDVSDVVSSHNIGDTLNLKIYRNGNYLDINVTLEENK